MSIVYMQTYMARELTDIFKSTCMTILDSSSQYIPRRSSASISFHWAPQLPSTWPGTSHRPVACCTPPDKDPSWDLFHRSSREGSRGHWGEKWREGEERSRCVGSVELKESVNGWAGNKALVNSISRDGTDTRFLRCMTKKTQSKYIHTSF